MIIMNLELKNIYGFCDFKINFSYPKKIVASTIENEFLINKPNFRYKKVNIIMGGNASGKTTLGKAMMDILNFIWKKNEKHLIEGINDTNEAGYFSIDFLLDDSKLYRVECRFFADGEKTEINLLCANILKSDSYESCCMKLKPLKNESVVIFETDKLNDIEGMFSWYFALTEGNEEIRFSDHNETVDLAVLEKILQALDSDILSVERLDIENSYVIRKKSQKIIIQDGEVIKENRLSSGTKSGIAIADMVSSIITNRTGFFFCDEKFSYIHSDIEKAILGIMIEKLHDGSQLFFTSHNMELLDMDLPKHSYTFLKKNECIEAVQPSNYLKKNTASLSIAVKNDMFNVSPSLEKLFEIEDIEYEK